MLSWGVWWWGGRHGSYTDCLSLPEQMLHFHFFPFPLSVLGWSINFPKNGTCYFWYLKHKTFPVWTRNKPCVALSIIRGLTFPRLELLSLYWSTWMETAEVNARRLTASQYYSVIFASVPLRPIIVTWKSPNVRHVFKWGSNFLPQCAVFDYSMYKK